MTVAPTTPNSFAPLPFCGGRMVIIETFQRGASPRIGQLHQPPYQDRYIMMKVNSRQHPRAAPLCRCLLTSNDQARLLQSPEQPSCR